MLAEAKVDNPRNGGLRNIAAKRDMVAGRATRATERRGEGDLGLCQHSASTWALPRRCSRQSRFDLEIMAQMSGCECEVLHHLR